MPCRWKFARKIQPNIDVFVFNTNPDSRLTAFDYIAFDDAYAWAREFVPEAIYTSGWYEKD